MCRDEGSAADDKPPPSSPLVAEPRCSSAAGRASAAASPAYAESAWVAVAEDDWRNVRAAVHVDGNVRVERAKRAPKVDSVLVDSAHDGQSRVRATRARTDADNIDS